MTQPRMVHAGTCYHLTRTTSGRRFLLKPGPIVNQVFRYCLFFAAAKYGVLIHSISVQRNHFHAVVTDTRGNISDFMEWLNGMISRNLIKLYAKTHPHQHLDGIWSKDHFNAVILANAEAVKDAIAYDLTNPVKDGLVSDYRQWPGVCSRPSDWLKSAKRVRRPRGLYSSDRDPTTRWTHATLTIPPLLANQARAHAIADIERLIREKTAAAHAQMRFEGRAFLGVKGLLVADAFDAPHLPRVKSPSVPHAAAGGDRSMLRAVLASIRAFRSSYREAHLHFCRGVRNIVFPAGTFLLQKRFNVACDRLHPPWCVT